MIKLREKEKVYSLKRRHYLVLFKKLSVFKIIFLIIIILMGAVFFSSFPELLIETLPFLSSYNPEILILYFLSLMLLILWQSIFVTITDYYLDCWIITDQRAIHTELRSLFSRIFSSVPHSRIQDVTVDVKGIIPTFLNYGDLQIQTAGKFQEFTFKQIPFPYKAKETIFKAQKEYYRKKEKEVDDNKEEIIINQEKEY